jgi:iron complex outermembrane receptor protein
MKKCNDKLSASSLIALSAAVTFSGLLAIPAAHAAEAEQDADAGYSGEIVVTSRRREERLSTIPVAVSAFNAAELEQRGVVDIRDFANTSPNTFVTTATTGRNAAVLKIRGQIQTDSLFTLDPSVGVYVDDVYMARAYGVLSEIVDVSGAEVLKGPQGTLFGRNTTGGAIRLTTAKADPGELAGSIKASYGNYNTFGLQGMINVPLIANVLAFRYAGAYNKHDGYTKAHQVPRGASLPTRVIDTDNRDSNIHRLSLTLTPGERFRLELSGELLNGEDNGTLYINQLGDLITGPTTAQFSPEHQADFY